MTKRDTLEIAIRAVKTNRLRSFLTILGIVIGITSVILLTSIVAGLKNYITNQIQGLGSNLMFIIPGKIGGARTPGGVQTNKLTFNEVRSLRTQLNTSADVSAIIQRTTSVKARGKSDTGVAIYGVEANYPRVISAIKFDEGRFFATTEASANRKVAVIGKTVASTLFIGSPLGAEVDIGGIKYKIIGVLSSRGSSFGVDNDNSVYIPLAVAMKQFGIDRLNSIYISARKTEEVKEIQLKATNILEKRLSKDDFSILTQEQTLTTVAQITGVLTIALGGIAAISLLVGGIGVMNIMLVSVTERFREIGLRKAVGARETDIRNQFLVEAIVLTSLGGIIGILIGIILSAIVNNFIQTTVTVWSIVLSLGFSMLVGIVFGVAPAIKASKLDPIQALRYE